MEPVVNMEYVAQERTDFFHQLLGLEGVVSETEIFFFLLLVVSMTYFSAECISHSLSYIAHPFLTL
jgi:hypothetical protein